MARRKKKESIVLENIELQPQIIGKTYQKKSNIIRVIIIFVIFISFIYFMDDINEFLNGSSDTPIFNNINNDNNSNNVSENENEKEETNYEFKDGLVIENENFSLTNFALEDEILSFSVVSKSENAVDLSNNKYFLEFLNESQTLLNRRKVDIFTLNNQQNFEVEMNEKFTYIALVEKTNEDYPVFDIQKDEFGYGSITCKRGVEEYLYQFKDTELIKVDLKVVNNDVNNENYYKEYSEYKKLIDNYQNTPGVSASFNGGLNGFSVNMNIQLEQFTPKQDDKNYYYSYKELPKVIKFEMETYGFNCE